MASRLPEPTVFVVDDDADLREALRWLIEGAGLNVECHAGGRDFIESYDPARPGCLVLDVRMPGMSGLSLQAEVRRLGHEIPIIVITGHGDVPVAVSAMKAGAMDFIEKPFSEQLLLEQIQRGIRLDAENRKIQEDRAEIQTRFDRLTPRERGVLNLLVSGCSSKEIASELEISAKTADVHRAAIMRKMGAGNLVKLVRMMHLLRD